MAQNDTDVAVSAGREVLAARVNDALARVTATGLAPGLYIVATPIGNLADITVRALGVLQSADFVLAEDTRHSGKLLKHYGIATPMRPYHEHNAARERPRIVDALLSGKVVALVSDAGTPLVSDPGFKLVRDVIAAGVDVVPVPGPSASLAALCGSGLATDAFLFGGFLPPKAGLRRERLQTWAGVSATLVLFEAPTRVASLLREIQDVFGEREVVVARELTKIHETFVRGCVSELAAMFEDAAPKGECVVLVAPAEKAVVQDSDIDRRLVAVLGDMSLRDAARAVASELDVPKGRVYELGLKIKQDQE